LFDIIPTSITTSGGKVLGGVAPALLTMVRLGVHVSVAGGIDLAVARAAEKGCDAFQIFSANPRGWKAKPISCEAAERFVAARRRAGLSPAVSHMPYLPNLASPRPEVYERSVQALQEEMHRCRLLEMDYLVAHPGSHLGEGREAGLDRVANALQTALPEDRGRTALLLESTAGSKNSIGGRFEDLAAILDRMEGEAWGEGLGVCLDTCHLHAAGYDLRSPAALQATLDEFEGLIGLKRVHLVHLNDCKSALGSHLDRHEHVGLGQIGEEGFRAVLRHPVLSGLPMILETPVDSRRNDVGNLQEARRLAGPHQENSVFKTSRKASLDMGLTR